MKKQAEAIIPTPWGEFNMIAFAEKEDEWMPHIALVHKDFDITNGPVLTRVHSECITGDLFSSKRCDCGEQLAISFKKTAEEGGVVLYLRQEGRGIGIINKLKAYELQDKGLNTIDANLHLGLDKDARQYNIAVDMLTSLGISEIRLLTNNPDKILAFDNGPIKVTDRVPIIVKPNEDNLGYLKTKQDEMGHLFKL
jgi:3,4-dihydroxy 2-butanone 4-phosphate synthase/GTP cyclohydrolase II